MGAKAQHHFALWAFVAWLVVTIMWWALAFAPLPAPPEWLESARSVCFGSLPNGLPDTWGWVSLFSPLTILGFLLAVWGRELAASLSLAWRSPASRVAIMLLFSLPVAGLGWVGARVSDAGDISAALQPAPASESLPTDYPRSTRVAPDLGLVNQTGDRVEVTDFVGRPVLLTFAYAHCQTVCPIVVETVRKAAVELRDPQPAVVIITLDPWRDTPSSLPSLYTSWGLQDLPDAHVLSGEVDRVLAVLEDWEVPMERDTANGEITHPALVHVLSPDGEVTYSFNGPPVAWVADAARSLG